MTTTTRETLWQYIKKVDPHNAETSPWGGSTESLVQFLVSASVWELPVEDAKVYLRKIGLLEDDHS